MQAYTDLLNRATNTANQPLEQYNGNLVAGFNDTQNQAFGNVNNTVGASQPYTQQAASLVYNSAQPTLGQLPGATQSLMNPYMQNAVGATASQMQNLFGQQQNQLTGQAIGAGAYGGDRAGVAAGNLANQQALAFGQTIGGMENQGYQQAQAAAMNSLSSDANRSAYAGMGLGSLGQQNLQNQLTTGGMQQQLAQEQLNIPYEQFVQRQSYPFQTTGWLGNLVEGLGSQMGGNSATYASGPNPIGQAAGLGIAGLGAAGAAGAFQNRGGRIERAHGGKSAGGDEYERYMPTDIPDVSVSPVTGQAPAGLGKGAPGAPGDQSNKGGAGALGGLDSASLKDAFKAGKQISDKLSGDPKDWNSDAWWKTPASDQQLAQLQADSAAGGGYAEDNLYPAMSTTASTAADTAAMDEIALMTIARGGRIHRSPGGGVSAEMPSVGEIADVSTSGLGSPVDLTGGGLGGGSAGKNNIPASPKMMHVAGDPGQGPDTSGQDAEQAIMMAIEIAALANRGGRIQRDSGGLVPSMPMSTDPNATTIPNIKPRIAYAPPGYIPGAGATFGQAMPDFQMTPLPPPPPKFDPGPPDAYFTVNSPGNTGANARGGAIHRAAGGGTAPGMAGGDPQHQDYTKLPLDQLNLLHAVTPDSAPQKPKIEQAIQVKQMGLGTTQAQPQQQQASVGLMPGSSAAAPQQQPVSLATGLPEPSPMQLAQSMAQGQPATAPQQQPAQAALGGPVSPFSQYQGFAGGGLVPIAMRPPTSRDGPYPRDAWDPYGVAEGTPGYEEGGTDWTNHLPGPRPTRDIVVRSPGYDGAHGEGKFNIHNRGFTGFERWNELYGAPSRTQAHARGGLVGYDDGGEVGEAVPAQEPLTVRPEMMPAQSTRSPFGLFSRERRDPYEGLVARAQAARVARGRADDEARAVRDQAPPLASSERRPVDAGLAARDDISPAAAMIQRTALMRQREREAAAAADAEAGAWNPPAPRPSIATARPSRDDISAPTAAILRDRDVEAPPPAVVAEPVNPMADPRVGVLPEYADDRNSRAGTLDRWAKAMPSLAPVGEAIRPLFAPTQEDRDRFAQGNERRRIETLAAQEPVRRGRGLVPVGAPPLVDDAPRLAEDSRPMPPVQGFDDAPMPTRFAEQGDYGPHSPTGMGPERPDVYGPNKPGAVVARPGLAAAPAASNAQLFADGIRLAHSQPGGAAGRPGLGAPAGGAAPATGATPTPAGATAAAKPEDTVEARSRKKYDDLIASLAYKPTPAELPKRDAKGNFWNAIMAGGLGMAASSSPNAVSAIGEGGLRGMGTFAKAQHDDDTAEQSAKKLHGETERWNKTFAHSQQETVRKAAKDEADEIKAERIAAQQARNAKETERQHLANEANAQARTEALFAGISARADRGNWTLQNVTEDDPDHPGQKRTKTVHYNSVTHETAPFEGGVALGKPSAASQKTFQAEWKYNAWLRANPGDEKGALEYAKGTRNMSTAQQETAASAMAKRELDIAMQSMDNATRPKNPTQFYEEHKQAALQRFREQGNPSTAAAPAAAASPARPAGVPEGAKLAPDGFWYSKGDGGKYVKWAP